MNSKLKSQLARQNKRYVFHTIEENELLYQLFVLNDKISINNLRILCEKLKTIIEMLDSRAIDRTQPIQCSYPEHDYDLDVNTISIYQEIPETIGEWKSRLHKLGSNYNPDSKEFKMIQEQKEKLFDRNNIPTLLKKV